jgi:cytochrome oxidase Cu insertion factor (SCO1/SenC/PrrC family)
MAGKEMEHTATVLLFDRSGNLAGTITADESDESALTSIKGLTG